MKSLLISNITLQKTRSSFKYISFCKNNNNDDVKFNFRLMRSQMLAKSQPNLADIGNDSGSDIYDSAGSMRSGTSTNTVNEDEPEKENRERHKVSLLSIHKLNLLKFKKSRIDLLL